MRTLLTDMAAGLLFFAVLAFTNDIYKATLAGVVFGVGVASWIWIKTRRLEPMQLLGLGLVLVMGSATIMFHDPRYMMYKPTVYFICVGLVMLKPGWMYRYMPKAKNAQQLPAASVRARRRFIEVSGAVYCAVTLGMALLNTLLAMYASQKIWALFNAAGAPVVYSVMGTFLWLGARTVRTRTEPRHELSACAAREMLSRDPLLQTGAEAGKHLVAGCETAQTCLELEPCMSGEDICSQDSLGSRSLRSLSLPPLPMLAVLCCLGRERVPVPGSTIAVTWLDSSSRTEDRAPFSD
jgi:intracellular septation protein